MGIARSELLLKIRNRVFGPPSVHSLLARYLPRKQFEQISFSCTDRRMIVAAVAAHCGMSEAVLVERLARRCKMPYVSRVPSFDPALLPATVGVNDLRAAGSAVKIIENVIVGIICIDPRAAHELLVESGKLARGLPLYFATWGGVQKALDDAQAVVNARQAEKDRERVAETSTVCGRLLELLIAEAENHRQHALEIFVGEDVEYQFCTAQGEFARGRIDARSRSILVDGIAQMSEQGAELLRPDGTLIDRLELSEQLLGDYVKYRLSWRPPWVTLLPGSVASPEIFAVPELPRLQEEMAVHVIDDNGTFGKVLERFLTKQGLQVTLSANALESLELLKSGRIAPSLVVCDVHMPGMNGESFLREFRSAAAIAHIPVVMLTSDEDTETEIHFVELGADAFVTKNQDPRLLAAQIRRLGRKSLGARAA